MDKIIRLPELQFIGFKTEITSSHSQNSVLIKSLWKKFNAALHQVENRIVGSDWKKFGLTFKIDGIYTYYTAIENSDAFTIPISFDKFSLDDLQYYLFEHKGDLTHIPSSVNYSFKTLEDSTKFNFDKNNINGLMMIEKYDERFNWYSPNSVVEILIPVVSKT